MDTANGYKPPFDDSPAVNVTGKIMVVAIILLFVVVVFVFFLHLYAKWFWWRVEETNYRNPRRRRRRFVFAASQDPAAANLRKGLDPSVLQSLPILIFNPEEFNEGLECAVCLSEVAEGEKARLLPKCNHGFHVECIDMWFQSHSTCPLCRNQVSPECSESEDSISNPNPNLDSVEENSDSNTLESSSSQNFNFPTNVLFWGNQTEVSSVGAPVEEGPLMDSNCSSSESSTSLRHDGVLVIDIPSNVTENLPAEEEVKSPMMARLRSLKRLLSKEKRVSPCSSSCVQEEQV